MLKLSSSQGAPDAGRELKTERLPTNVTALSLSWINGRFRALAIHRGVVDGLWERPGEADDLVDFPSLLRDAVQQTGFRGSTICMVLAHPRLVQQLLEAPPPRAGGLIPFLERQIQMMLYMGMPPDGQSTLVRYVQRQVQQLKTFEGEAAWAHETTEPAKDNHGVLLHLFPKNLLSILVQGSQKADLFLTAVYPPTAVLNSQLRELPLAEDEVALLAADTGNSTAVLVGRRDGRILLGRTLTGSWNQNAARFAVDLKRTILFVNQEFATSVNSVWLFGLNAHDHIEHFQSELEIPTRLSPVEYHDFYWARETVMLPPQSSVNLISRELQEEPRRRKWLKVAACTTILLVLVCLAASLFLENLVREERRNLASLRTESADLQTRHKQLQALHDQLARKQDLLKLVHDGKPPPVPGWFLGYLSEAVPPDLLITNLTVKRELDIWRVQLGGKLQPTTNATPGVLLSNAVATLTNRLAGHPFYLKIEQSTPLGLGESELSTNLSFTEWVAKLSSQAGTRPGNQLFDIEGVMR